MAVWGVGGAAGAEMEKGLRVCDRTLEVLRDMITGDSKDIKTEYRSGPKLVEFFNRLGFNDSYVEDFPSRKKYVQDRLQVINGTARLDDCIKALFCPINFVGKDYSVKDVLSYFNEYLSFDGWNVVVKEREVSFERAGFELKCDKKDTEHAVEMTEEEFLAKEVGEVSKINLGAWGFESALVPVLKQRLGEIELCIKGGAWLSAVILCGSTLEGVLLGLAQKYPREFSTAKSAPKKDGRPRQFCEWGLANYIDVACEVGMIKLDTKKFGHALRDFRNYVHPYEQMYSRFEPREETARLSWQVVRCAISDIAEYFGQK